MQNRCHCQACLGAPSSLGWGERRIRAALIGEDPSPSLVRGGRWELQGKENQRGCSGPAMQRNGILVSGLAGLPANAALLLRLRHPLNLRGCGVIGVREAKVQ